METWIATYWPVSKHGLHQHDKREAPPPAYATKHSDGWTDTIEEIPNDSHAMDQTHRTKHLEPARAHRMSPALRTAAAGGVAPGASRGEGGDEGGSWQVGPGLEVSLTLFDPAQARIGRDYTETRRALYHRDILLPLRERIVNEAQLPDNAMQLGVFGLLQARERQIQTAGAYVETLRDDY